MRRYPLRAAGAVVAASVLVAGCSSADEQPPASSSSTPTASSAPEPTAPTSMAPDDVGVSPDGVTTAVGAPAESTEDDYFQACRAAKTWMDEQGGDPKAQIEPYLKAVQTEESAGPGTFNKRWSELTRGQQSGVIVAVEAAADALCG